METYGRNAEEIHDLRRRCLLICLVLVLLAKTQVDLLCSWGSGARIEYWHRLWPHTMTFANWHPGFGLGSKHL
jgi:hypothetical protein